jgi:heterotetrameric sarcosine oxidase gamma subunit
VGEPNLWASSSVKQAVGISAPIRPAGTPAVVLGLHNGVALATVMARANKLAQLRDVVLTEFGLNLPTECSRVARDGVSFAWAGPGQWLAAMENAAGHVFETDLARNFAGLASVSNQTDGRTIIRISGPKARETLAKSVPVDLHPRAFRPEAVALTSLGNVGVHLWQLDETPLYEIAVFRSFAVSIWELLLAGAAEYGVLADAGQ